MFYLNPKDEQKDEKLNVSGKVRAAVKKLKDDITGK